MLVMNATKEEQRFRALGNWFTFKPGQIREMQDHMAQFIADRKYEQGMVLLPDSLQDPDFAKSEEGKAIVEAARAEGVEKYLKYHRDIIANHQLSLRRDLEQANIKAGPEAYTFPGELASMKIVAAYQAQEADIIEAKSKEVRELMNKINKKA